MSNLREVDLFRYMELHAGTMINGASYLFS